jgi:hypothetical protein
MGWPHLPLTPVGSPRRLNRTCGGPARTSGGRHRGRRCRGAVSGERTASVSAARRRLGPRTPQAAAGTSHDHGHGEADLDVAAGRGGRRPSGPDRLQGVSRRPASRRRLLSRAPRVTGRPVSPVSPTGRRAAFPAGQPLEDRDAGVVLQLVGLGGRGRAASGGGPPRAPVAPPTASSGRDDAGKPSPTSPPLPPRGGTGTARPGRRDPASGAGLSCPWLPTRYRARRASRSPGSRASATGAVRRAACACRASAVGTTSVSRAPTTASAVST